MTPEEKWNRINNPKTIKDYGLTLNESELRTFKKGRELILEMRLIQRHKNKLTRL